MFKLPSKSKVYKEFLNNYLKGKQVRLFFAEYGKEGSNCKYIVESSLERLNIHQYWQPINIKEITVTIKDCEKCSIGNWFKIFFDSIEYANLSISSAIITSGSLTLK